ncbi:hypothetical protein F9L69_03465 [Brucella melitensis]|uniref:Uncharacterized protein n=1 Tax=Brucella melitensis TaxID=29459 RepID=A0AB36PUG3_BRUML|nr:conserved hypothetical protein [Brucella melitensis M28]AQQ55747.1 hypothetical protein ADS42_000670 [Brucella melitensis]EEZ17692.1 predicted protein [Brucella melitensis bv. 2 str. 63/9]RTQ42259.1 hypothetical protein EJW28_04545 [Brucella abortus]ARX99553.1 hypothetical protein BK201_07235 [Brucella melitensis]
MRFRARPTEVVRPFRSFSIDSFRALVNPHNISGSALKRLGAAGAETMAETGTICPIRRRVDI